MLAKLYIIRNKVKILLRKSSLKKLSNLFNKDQFVLISNNLDCDIARISNLFYRDKTTKEILSLPEAITGTSSDVSINSIIDNGVIIGDNFSMDSFRVYFVRPHQ